MRVLTTAIMLAFVFSCTSTGKPPADRSCARGEAPRDDNLQEVGTVSGQSISATANVLVCNHPGLAGSVDCEASGPGIVVIQSSARQMVFTLARGERATIDVGATGATCRLVS